jgi:hypothetical protein
MVDLYVRSKTRGVGTLIQRRSRRGAWVYAILLLAYYMPTAMMLASEMRFANPAQAWPLLVPLVVVIVQWVRPTILGWACIAMPTFLYFCIGVYYAVANNLGPSQQWEYDREGVVFGTVYLTVLLGVCMALTFAAWPRASRDTNAD